MAYHLKYKGPAIDERLDLAGTALQEHQDISHLANQADVISGLNKKVDKVDGKGLSTEDYTTAEKQKLAALDTTIKQAVDELQVEVAKKQDSIEDLEEIREGASKGATALQEHQDISNLATKGEVGQGLSTKVDKAGNETITGVKTFNSGVNFLGSGDTNAVTLSTNTRINVNGTNKTVLGFGSGTFYINHGDYKLLLRGKETRPTYNSTTLALSSDVNGKQDKVNGKGLSTEDFTSALKTKLEGLSNYDDTELSTALSTLRGDFDTLVSGDTTTAIKTFNEVIAFLENISDTEDLAGIIASIEQQLMWTKAEGEAGVRLKGTNGTATGNLAISAGDDKTASDGTPFASVASGDHAVVFGYGNTCSGRTTLAQGLYNIVTAKDSVAFGQRNLVNGDQAFAVGMQNEVTTRLGVAIGYKNKTTNTDSIAIGYQNTSSGSASVAMGDTCEANGTSSTAMGYKTKATGAYSSTFGQNTQATNNGEVAMGLYNKSTTSTDASEQTLFSFGIGTSDTNRANAFEIKKNGDVYIGDKILSNFATSQYVDEAITNAIITTLNTEV